LSLLAIEGFFFIEKLTEIRHRKEEKITKDPGFKVST